MLPRCVYCWITYDLVKCKLVGCSNLLCPDHVKNHGGQLWACANSGGGASFHFTLPLQVTESSPLVA
jgi:hypothetical protein